jgi:hypothetical protein
MVQEIAPIQYNFKILDFTPVSKEISKLTLSDMEKYDLLGNPKFSRDVKKLLLHHTIHCVCETFIKRRSNTPCVLYFAKNTYNTKLHGFFSDSLINDELYQNVVKIKNILPIRVYIASEPFEMARLQIEENSGEGIDILSNIKYCIDNHQSERFTFSRIKQYTNRHKLTFLNENYFNRLKTKNLLFA